MDLRSTILVRPTFLNPTLPLPSPLSSSSVSPSSPTLHLNPLGLTPEDLKLPIESKGGIWYGTRVQTILTIQRMKDEDENEGKWRVVFRERDAFVLEGEGPIWSGVERVFEFFV